MVSPRTFTRCIRQYSTSRRPLQSIYASKSTNPYFNLSLEDWLFRNKSHNDPLLLLYRDDPCVVIGRNQNPWKEVNMPLLRHSGVPFIRRRSGGGTVYHDLGNSNFSIHLPRASFDRNQSAQVVLRAVKSLGIPDANVNDRNDVCVDMHVSGSAYKIVNSRAYHHGTMLISTQLGTLGALLRSNKDTMITKGVASVPSPVCNLQQYNPDVTHEGFVNAVVQEFQKNYNVHEPIQWVDDETTFEGAEDIQKGMAELSTWNWAFGQTPEFTYTLQHKFTWGEVSTKIHSKHGVLLSCAFDLTGTEDNIHGVRDGLDELSRALEGQRYGSLASQLEPGQEQLRDLWNALNYAMTN